MKAFKALYVCLVSILTFSSISKGQSTDPRYEVPNGHYSPYQVPISDLIANPIGYNNKPVQVLGYLHLEFEGDAIYPTEQDYLNHRFKKAIWVHINQFKLRQASYCNNHYVIIEGVFDGKDFGHIDLWSGAIRDITGLRLQTKHKQRR